MMAARRVTTVTIPVDPRTTAELRTYRDHTPLLTIMAVRSPLMVNLTLPQHLQEGHVWFARQLADEAARYATEVERAWRGLVPLPSYLPA